MTDIASPVPIDGAAAVAQADSYSDPTSLAAATALRGQFAPDVAAWAITQVELRRKAVAKLGERAASMYFTSAGLEQATRATVSDWRAARLRALGVPGVIDLTAGLGADALALGLAGLHVVAVERDPATAAYLAHNLAPVKAEVVVGDAVLLADELLATHPDYAVFIDPARRTAAGRSWRTTDLAPSWEFITGLLDGSRQVVVKLGPGFPLESLPAGLEACWVSDRGDLVELSLWPGEGRRVVRLGAAQTAEPNTVSGAIELYSATPPSEPPAAPIAAYIIEPDPAVIRSGLAVLLSGQLTALHPGIAYLSSSEPLQTPLATTFEVLETLPYRETDLKAWVRTHEVGTLEIKCRGVTLDPAMLRRKLRPSGPAAATFIISPTLKGTLVFVVRRAGTRLA